MTITQQRTLDEQIAHENSLIDSWTSSDDYNSITDLSDLDNEEGLDYEEDDFDDEDPYNRMNFHEEELYDGGDYSLE